MSPPVVASRLTLRSKRASGGRHNVDLGGAEIDISYLVPDGADPAAGEPNSRPRSGCEVIPKVGGVGTDRLTVDLRLYWSNPYGSSTPAAEQACRLSGDWSPNVGTMRLAEASMDATILTGGGIVDRDGTVLLPAAPGNAVPKLDRGQTLSATS
ncbi:hypothetical protein ACAG26_00305 [Mycobacterium sp. pUA109]|uniref:hypothetical protein n=1 Tax=Mycobacterium sp. pUA109 TaxID=3238982 RepID=UPI00351B6987